MSLIRSRIAVAGFAALGALLSGCGGMSVKGVVVDGPRSTAITVGAGDERLTEPGVAGVSVRIEGGGFYEEVVSDEDGAFKISVPKTETDRVLVVVSGEGVDGGEGRVYLPRDGQKLLVIADRDR